jgi:hypothetical protein
VAVAPQAESSTLTRATIDTKTNHLDFISLSLGNLIDQWNEKTIEAFVSVHLLSYL